MSRRVDLLGLRPTKSTIVGRRSPRALRQERFDLLEPAVDGVAQLLRRAVEELGLHALPGPGRLAVDEDHRPAVAAEVVAARRDVRMREALAPVARIAHLVAVPLRQQVDRALSQRLRVL